MTCGRIEDQNIALCVFNPGIRSNLIYGYSLKHTVIYDFRVRSINIESHIAIISIRYSKCFFLFCRQFYRGYIPISQCFFQLTLRAHYHRCLRINFRDRRLRAYSPDLYNSLERKDLDLIPFFSFKLHLNGRLSNLFPGNRKG